MDASTSGTFIYSRQGTTYTSTAKLPRATELGINVDKPLFPTYTDALFRQESYKELNWPESASVNVDDLVEAGFVFAGKGDIVWCYWCGGGLKNWEEGNNPMVEHARWYPKCPHVLQVKGHKFVKAVAKGEHTAVQRTNENGFMDSEAVKALIENKYSEDIIIKAVQIFVEKKGHSDFSGTDLCEIILELEESLSDHEGGGEKLIKEN